jgi:hypothetical protein
MLKRVLFLSLLFSALAPLSLRGEEAVEKHPFAYDLHLSTLAGTKDEVLICCHGYGGNYRIAHILKEAGVQGSHLVSFNFPDHDLRAGDGATTVFGTIEELLPSLYVVKKHVIDQKRDRIHLYGFSAGGGVVINMITVLSSSAYDSSLQTLGIGSVEKEKMLLAIEKGSVVLDAPLKSIEEISAFKGASPALEIVGQRYQDNGFVPIDNLHHLEGLSLNVWVYFEHGDEILSNRDDVLFIERLQKYNAKGKTVPIFGSHGGHNRFHSALWQAYLKEQSTGFKIE